MKILRALILEDDILTLSKIFNTLSKIEDELGVDFSATVLSEYTQVEKYINKDTDNTFDLVLLDRDCKLGGSFHVLDFRKFAPDKIIGISSVFQYNEDLKKHGVKKVILKEYTKLDIFAEKLYLEIKQIFGSK